MRYKTPKIPEGINVTKVHPLKTFAVLVCGLLLALLLISWLLGFAGGYLASKVPFSQEVRLAATYDDADTEQEQTELLGYLQGLADNLSQHMDLEEGMQITVHYMDEDVDNAFATIGGNVFLYRGLLEKLPNENALAMLLAHEIAHVKHRDPIVSVGQGAAVSMGMMLLGDATPSLLGNTGLLTQMNFGREMESKADQAALAAVNAIYDDVGSALALYRVLNDLEGDGITAKPPEFLSTHPASENRLNELTELANRNGWRLNNDAVPFSEVFSQNIQSR